MCPYHGSKYGSSIKKSSRFFDKICFANCFQVFVDWAKNANLVKNYEKSAIKEPKFAKLLKSDFVERI